MQLEKSAWCAGVKVRSDELVSFFFYSSVPNGIPRTLWKKKP